MIQIDTLYFIGLMALSAVCGAAFGVMAFALCHMSGINSDGNENA